MILQGLFGSRSRGALEEYDRKCDVDSIVREQLFVDRQYVFGIQKSLSNLSNFSVEQIGEAGTTMVGNGPN